VRPVRGNVSDPLVAAISTPYSNCVGYAASHDPADGYAWEKVEVIELNWPMGSVDRVLRPPTSYSVSG
jgi:hypothetical protein